MDREALRLECLKAAVNTGRPDPVALAREMFEFVTGATKPSELDKAVETARETLPEKTAWDAFAESNRPAGSPPIADVVGCNSAFDPGWVDKLKADAAEPEPRAQLDPHELTTRRVGSFKDYTPDPPPEG